MKVLVDSNVVLNKLLKHPDFFTGSNAIFTLAEIGQIANQRFDGYISASAVTDIYYIAKKNLGKATAHEAIKKMLQIFHPATVTDNNIYRALDLEWDDFEDSVQYIVGEGLTVDYIITRNIKDFVSGSIPAVTPEQFIKTITDIEE